MPHLEARDLSVELDGNEVLHDLAFAVKRGTWLGLAGPNGAGKTTLLRAIAGILPFSGSLHLDGRGVGEWPARQRAQRIALVRQTQELAFDFPVRDFVLLGRAAHRGWLEPFSTDDRLRAEDALAQVGLEGFENRLVAALSGGEQQRVRLAQALVQDTPLLLLDEPTAHLDVHHQLDLMERVRRLVEAGKTVISALHDLPLAARYVDRLLVLDQGHLAAEGPPVEVLTADLFERVFRVRVQIDPADPAVIRYLSPSP